MNVYFVWIRKKTELKIRRFKGQRQEGNSTNGEVFWQYFEGHLQIFPDHIKKDLLGRNKNNETGRGGRFRQETDFDKVEGSGLFRNQRHPIPFEISFSEILKIGHKEDQRWLLGGYKFAIHESWFQDWEIQRWFRADGVVRLQY